MFDGCHPELLLYPLVSLSSIWKKDERPDTGNTKHLSTSISSGGEAWIGGGLLKQARLSLLMSV